MKRCIGLGTAVALIVGAVALSGTATNIARNSSFFSVNVEEKNPWNNLEFNTDPAQFQFALVSDRTGGHRAKIFSQTIQRINLMQPEFVLSVGDLIEGGKEDLLKLNEEWDEFDKYVSGLEMPFFYVPGNHDISNTVQEKLWAERLGRSFYHFVYKDVLFLMLNSEDPPRSSTISKKQLAYAEKILKENMKARWTIVCLHRPIWSAGYGGGVLNGWADFEKLLGERPYTVFCGHHHVYQKFVRNGRDHYQLATTGGGSRLRGPLYGEFDQIAWVTMKKDGPIVANILVEGILPDTLRTPKSDETGRHRGPPPETYPVTGTVTYNGNATPGAYVYFMAMREGRLRRVADGMVEQDGKFKLSTQSAFDGCPPGEYSVGIFWRQNIAEDDGRVIGEEGGQGRNLLPRKYLNARTSGLKATIKEGENNITFELSD